MTLQHTHNNNMYLYVDYVPQNGEEMALSRVGKELYELLFKHYTKKQVRLPESVIRLGHLGEGKG